MKLRFCGDMCRDGYMQDRRAGLFGAEAYMDDPEACSLCGYWVPSRATIRATGRMIVRDPRMTPGLWQKMALPLDIFPA